MSEGTDVRNELAAEIFGQGSVGAIAPIEPIVEAETEAQQTSAEPEQIDPWAGVTPALREQFDALQARLADIDALNLRVKTAEGRVGALQSELAKRAKEPEGPTKAQIEQAAAEEKEWELLKADMPELVTPMEKRLAAQRAELLSKMPEMPDIDGKLRSVVENLSATMEERIVAVKHPGYEKTITTPEFKEWLAAQPPAVQSLTTSRRAEDAISVLDAFVGRKPSKIVQDRQKRLAQAEPVKSSPGTPLKSESDMTPEELRQHLTAKIWSKP